MGPKILLFDIETAPILGYVWGLWENNVGLNQIKSDWYVIAWAAKWLDAKTIMYRDQRRAKNIEDDRDLLRGIWDLLDKADIVITQNGKAFDEKKLNARFVLNGMNPPSSFRHIDIKVLAKRHFGFTSNKLEYMTDKLCTKHKKTTHREFPGFDLWKECLAGNKKAWRAMEEYNKADVLSLEELYKKLIPWDGSINFNSYRDDEDIVCTCGSKSFKKRGFFFTNLGKYQRYRCKDCGAETRSRKNLIRSERKATIRLKTR